MGIAEITGYDIGVKLYESKKKGVSLVKKNMTIKEAEELEYEFELLADDTYELTFVPVDIKTAYIPETFEGKKVSKIGPGSFFNCTSINSIVIPDSVESIRISAFDCCACLKSVHIGNRVKIIEQEAFFGCTSLTSIRIPNSVKYIGDAAFSHCSNLETFSYPCDAELGDLILENCPKLKIIEAV